MGALLLPLLTLLAVGAIHAQQTREQRNFDARGERNSLVSVPPTVSQRAAEQALSRDVPGLAVAYDRVSGVARSIRVRTGYLSGPNPNANPRALAHAFASSSRGVLGLSADDLAGYEVTDEVASSRTGATHVYMRQLYRGIPVYNGQLQVNVNREGRVMGLNNSFVADLARSVNTRRPGISAVDAVAQAAQHLGLRTLLAPTVIEAQRSGQRTTVLRAPQLSLDDVTANLFWLFVGPGETRLVWNFQIQTLDSQHWYDFNVDAVTGEVWTRFDWTNSSSFRVYEQPAESPQHTTPLPPSDARSLVINPEDSTASPNGWFNPGGTIMDGNNVHACADTNANNQCDSGQPSCGSSQNCDFSISLTSSPSASIPAAITNLFYWNNVVHDVQYQYGFDEQAGNFQESNFGKGGVGSDSVNADAQDGSGNCNANFGTPTDGGNPRMQMFTCNNASPARDGDYDAGVIVHEYGHGISVRQVGGPGNSSCLNNNQQAGEGWSDFFGLVYTARPGDLGSDARGIGSYLFGLPPSGTIRDLRYSTDPAINNWTYASISGAAIPHGVGSRWAQALWEVYWALVDVHGFDPDLLHPGSPGWSGNQRALLYVNEGLKNTACSPTFIDARDGIIEAATDLFGGEDVCTIWQAFAGFGLGTNASTPGPGSTSATNGFNVPASCQCSPQPTADAGPDRTICVGDSTVLGTSALPGHSYEWFPGGQSTAQITVSPSLTTVFDVTATTICGSDTDSVTVTVDDGSAAGLDEDFEGDTSGWTATGLWHRATNSTCASPQNGYSSPTSAFYYGQDASCNYATGGSNSGTLTSPPIGGVAAGSTLTFDYFRQVESFNGDFDRTRVEIVSGSGSTTVFSLNATNPSTLAWGSSGAIDLSAFAGQTIRVRFVFETVDGVDNDQIGWFVDDVVVTGESSCTPGNTPPSVTITGPPSGTSVSEGTAVNFSGTASDAEDGNLTASIAWSSSLDGALGTGGSVTTSTLSVGAHTITASVTDSGGLTTSSSIDVTITGEPPPSGDFIDWTVTANVSYADQDVSGTVAVEDGGATLLLQNNTWRRTIDTFTIGPTTVVELDFQSTAQGEIHGFGFDENDVLNDDPRHFQVYGSQNWTGAGKALELINNGYAGSGAFEPFQVNVGAFFTGSGRLVLINDNDTGSGNNSRFRNVRVRQCTRIDDFEDGTSEGWTNSGASTCSTGSFVGGTPTQVVDGGVVTQLAGDHSRSSGRAYFTATNSSAGGNDVDGGNCIATSPVINVAGDSDVSIWYFHGQRDAGDDPTGDFFRLEASIDGGAFTTIASFGDETVNATWRKASVPVLAGQSVRFRVQASDGPATGDLVEAGVDDITVCPQ
jgi:extracellular elastinolytic metalloproteinase